jgi:thiosulfate/3-mercaptopyruvate sulfurtransferase
MTARRAVPAAVLVALTVSALALASPPAAVQVIQPEDLARSLAGKAAQRPLLVHVGFKYLFQIAHIPGSRFAGPGSKPEGLTAMKLALVRISREKPVVLYCGCCPWADCPNVHPAYRAAREMGFKDVRVLLIAKNLQHDWIDKGLPIEKGGSDPAPR